MKAYKQRIADRLLVRKLAGKGAVLLEGAKWCGKTTTAEQIARSVLYMSESGKIEQNKQLATMNPGLLLRGDKPRLIDEWQVAPQLWDSIRFEADHSHELGLFILTGLRIGDELVAGGDGADMAGASRSVCSLYQCGVRLVEQLGRGHQLLQLDWDIVITERPTNDQIHWLY